MSAKLADNALTTLEDVKIMLGIAPDDVDEQRDAMLVNLINYASAWIERMTGRKLGRQQYTQRYVASGTQELVLLQWPIINVEYVKDTTDGSIIPPEEYDYTVDGEAADAAKAAQWLNDWNALTVTGQAESFDGETWFTMTVTPLDGEPVVLEWAKTEEAAAVRQGDGVWKIVDMNAVQTLLEFWNASEQTTSESTS